MSDNAPKKVFVVQEGEYEDTQILGVFSSLGAAQEVLGKRYGISAWQVFGDATGCIYMKGAADGGDREFEVLVKPLDALED